MARDGLLIYGANGFTGRLIVKRALARGLRPVVAGRNRAAIEALAASLGLTARVVDLEQSERLRSAVASARIVLNAAGPFAFTAEPLIAACVAEGSHYLDVSGDVPVLEAAAGWHNAATRSDVMVMPGSGFDVVPSDCLATHVARRLPGAVNLKVGFEAPTQPSRGSLRTALEYLGRGVYVRRGGKVTTVPLGSLSHSFDFGPIPCHSMAVSLGDVSTAYHSTGIPNIETYLRATPPVYGSIVMARLWGPLLRLPASRALMDRQIARLPEGPTREHSRRAKTTIVAEATDSQGAHAAARLRVPEPYAFTARIAVRLAEHVLDGQWMRGFQTPSSVYGPDFVLGFRGVTRKDL